MKILQSVKDELKYLRILTGEALEFRALSIAVGVIAIVISVFNGIGLSFVIPLLNNIQTGGDGTFFVFRRLGIEFASRQQELFVILGIILVSTMSVSVMTYTCLYLGSVLQEKVIIHLRGKVLRATYGASYRFFIERPVGALSDIFIQQVRQNGNAVYTLIQFGLNIAMTLVYAILLLMISAPWTVAVISVYVLLTIFVQSVTKRIHYFNSIAVTKNQEISANYVNDILGIKLVKVFNMRRTMLDRYEPMFHVSFKAMIRAISRTLMVQPFMEAVSILIIIGFMMVYIKVNPESFYSNLRYLVAYFFVMQRMKQSLFNANSFRAYLQRLRKGVINVDELLKNNSGEVETGKKEFPGFSNAIEFKNVSFEYEAGKPVLKDISFSIRKGEMVAVVGPSGSGKTTILDLLLKFIAPGSGSIEIDGVNLAEIDTGSYYRNIGLVLQEAFLFDNSVYWNIARGETEKFSRERVREASVFSNIDSYIQTLDDGYDSLVGDRGGRLSGGEKQRISIARAVVHDPQIIVMDEPTSALDGSNEKIVMNSVESIRKDRTIVLITHKLSAARQADRIIVLDNGEFIAMGTHEELLLNSEYYRNLQEAGM